MLHGTLPHGFHPEHNMLLPMSKHSKLHQQVECHIWIVSDKEWKVEDGGKEVEQRQFLSKVTSLGRAIAAFPLAPRFGKMLALAHQHDLLGLSLPVQHPPLELFELGLDVTRK